MKTFLVFLSKKEYIKISHGYKLVLFYFICETKIIIISKGLNE